MNARTQINKSASRDQAVKTPTTINQIAEELINGQRQQDYGDKLSNFTQIAMLFSGVLAHKLNPGTTITADDVALLMIQVKVARLAKTPTHFDSIVDIAGYAGCLSKLQLERAQLTDDNVDSLLEAVLRS